MGGNWRRGAILGGALALAWAVAACGAGGPGPAPASAAYPAAGALAAGAPGHGSGHGSGGGAADGGGHGGDQGQGPRSGRVPRSGGQLPGSGMTTMATATRTPAAPPARPSPVPAPPPSASPGPAPTPAPLMVGWYAASSRSFDRAAFGALPVKPVIANYYSGWWESFKADFARAAAADGMETLVEMEPGSCNGCGPGGYVAMTDIAAGRYDKYLTGFGAQIQAYGSPVLVTFAHEMNGRWYPWGQGGAEGVTPAQWIAAWDHVVTVVGDAAPGLVTWVWAPNVENGAGPVAPYWPGPQYVGMVGIDGYLNSDSDTYESVFGRTVADIRALTSVPIWIAETGVNIDASTGARLAAYVAAIRAARLRGLLYFNEKRYALPGDDLAALAAAINSPGRGAPGQRGAPGNQ